MWQDYYTYNTVNKVIQVYMIIRYRTHLIDKQNIHTF